MLDGEKFNILNQQDIVLNEPNEFYNDNRAFTTLEAWKKCREVKIFFYNKILPRLPAEEKFNLDFQIRKASISTTSNISEACLPQAGIR